MHGQTNRRIPRGIPACTSRKRSTAVLLDLVQGRGQARLEDDPGGERDAVTARASVMSKLGQGEKVAPSRETFLPFAESWLDSQRDTLGERTIDQYDRAIRLHLGPAFGRLPLHKIDEDRIARFIADMTRRGYAAWTIRGTLIPLGRIRIKPCVEAASTEPSEATRTRRAAQSATR
jgi:hypothetical protein